MRLDKHPRFVAHYREKDACWQSLSSHLLGTAQETRDFARKVNLPKLGELMGLLHDLGKYSREFQNYLKSALGALNPDLDGEWVDASKLKGKVDHSTAGAQFIWSALGTGFGKDTTIAAQLAALCIASHHSGLIDCLGADGSDSFTARMQKDDARSHLAEAIEQADPEVLMRANELLADPELAAESRRLLASIEQQNASDELVTPKRQQFGLWVRVAFSCLIAGDRIDTARFERPGDAGLRQGGRYIEWPKLVARLEQTLHTFPARHPIDELRRSISLECLQSAQRAKGIYTLTVPTGGGKTLASLRFALHHAERRKLERIIYVIPFTSIIDQNAKVVRRILEPDHIPEDSGRVVLEHHSNVTPDRQTLLEKILCEDWDSPVVYTTMVQFLESLFGAGTRGVRRMHQLANAVIVFDEVQTLPVRCVHLFNNAVNFLAEQCNSTVVLCTATQPLLERVACQKGAIRLSSGHSLISDVTGLFEKLRRVEIKDARKAAGWSIEEVARLALSELHRSGSCLTIVNTKRSARNLFELIAPEVGEEAIFHLSTSMCPAHRKSELERLQVRLDSGAPVVCISTQLIEAGVDVDFGSVIRFLAGLDSIAQAAGRCNRNGNNDLGTVHIVNLADEKLEMLPDIAEGIRQAQRVLNNFAANPGRYDNDLLSPKALEEYYSYYFFRRACDMSYPVSADDVGVSTTLLELLSQNTPGLNAYGSGSQMAPRYLFRQAFATAARLFEVIDAPTEGIVVPYGDDGEELIKDLCGAFDLRREPEILRKAQQYTVNVFPNVLKRLSAAKAFHTINPELRIHCLAQDYYSQRFGLSAAPVNQLGPLIWDS